MKKKEYLSPGTRTFTIVPENPITGSIQSSQTEELGDYEEL